ncbi:PEGA domain-containing protein [Candidatus Latescibacterota bacterium]
MKTYSTVFHFTILIYAGIFSVTASYGQQSTSCTVAVLDLEANGVSNVEAKGLSEKIRTRISWLINTESYINSPESVEYAVVERSQIEKILQQFDIQSAVCTDISCAVEFGKMLQVDRVIIGSVNFIGKTYNVSSRLIDVETAKTISVAEVDHKGSIDNLLSSRVPDVADELILGIPFNEWENSEFISITGNPDDALISINRKTTGRTPILNKMIPLGNNKIRIKKIGYEDYTENIRTRKGNPYQLNYILSPKTRKRTFMKSLVFPGSGQRYAEYKGKGYIITLLQLATIAGVVETTIMSMDAQDKYDEAKEAYSNSGSQDEFSANFAIMEDKYDDTKSAHTLQLISAGAALAVYLYNLYDAAFTEPRTEDKFSWNSLRIEPKIATDNSSISISMRF